MADTLTDSALSVRDAHELTLETQRVQIHEQARDLGKLYAENIRLKDECAAEISKQHAARDELRAKLDAVVRERDAWAPVVRAALVVAEARYTSNVFHQLVDACDDLAPEHRPEWKA